MGSQKSIEVEAHFLVSSADPRRLFFVQKCHLGGRPSLIITVYTKVVAFFFFSDLPRDQSPPRKRSGPGQLSRRCLRASPRPRAFTEFPCGLARFSRSRRHELP